jgi:hypothetical protein
MADSVATQIVQDGERFAILKLTNISDGTGEAAVVKVDVSALATNARGVACSEVKINKIWASTDGMAVRLLWDATTDVLAWALPANVTYGLDFSQFGGIQNNSGTGKTGDLVLTTVGHTSGDTYTLVLECLKVYG